MIASRPPSPCRLHEPDPDSGLKCLCINGAAAAQHVLSLSSGPNGGASERTRPMDARSVSARDASSKPEPRENEVSRPVYLIRNVIERSTLHPLDENWIPPIMDNRRVQRAEYLAAIGAGATPLQHNNYFWAVVTERTI